MHQEEDQSQVGEGNELLSYYGLAIVVDLMRSRIKHGGNQASFRQSDFKSK
jgi:hypothetical protein